MRVGVSVGCAGRRRKLRDWLMRCDGVYNEPTFQQHAGNHNATSHVSPHSDLHASSRLVCVTQMRIKDMV